MSERGGNYGRCVANERNGIFVRGKANVMDYHRTDHGEFFGYFRHFCVE